MRRCGRRFGRCRGRGFSLLADALCAGLPTPHILRTEVSSEPRETFGQVKRRGQETRAERVTRAERGTRYRVGSCLCRLTFIGEGGPSQNGGERIALGVQ
jgi:hypothetical protein